MKNSDLFVTRREMLSRYGKAAERERAVAAARRVNVGDRL